MTPERPMPDPVKPETLCTHCWHNDGFVYTSMPPCYRDVCCRCGALSDFYREDAAPMPDLSKHGPFHPGAR